MLDVATLEVIALQPAPMQNMAWTSFAFSPTGKRLACKVFVNKVFVYDVADGAPLSRDLAAGHQRPADAGRLLGRRPPDPGRAHAGRPGEPGPALAVSGQRARRRRSNGVCWFEVAANQNQAGALIPAKVPQPGFRRSLERAMRDPNFFIFKTGLHGLD